jgi:parvulin-like peptidyl-prolyl isomerase
MPMYRTSGAIVVALVLAAAAPASAQDGNPPARRARERDAAARPGLVVDRVVAVVNDDIILDSELRRRLAPLAIELQDIADGRERERRRKVLASQVLDEMVNEEIILDAAEDAKLEVAESEIDSAVDEIKRQNNVDDAGLAEALEQQGYTMSGYRADVRRQIIRMRAVNVMVRPRVTVTDEDVQAAYDARSRRSGAVNKVRLHHVLIAVPQNPSQAQLAEAKQKAAEVVQQARAGTPFAELAARYSDDTATANDGGELGWIERGSIATEWEAVVFGMSEGEVRGPVSGPSGLHVFYVSEVEKSKLQAFDDVKEQLRNDLFRREMDKQTQLWLDEERKKAFVELKL